MSQFVQEVIPRTTTAADDAGAYATTAAAVTRSTAVGGRSRGPDLGCGVLFGFVLQRVAPGTDTGPGVRPAVLVAAVRSAAVGLELLLTRFLDVEICKIEAFKL